MDLLVNISMIIAGFAVVFVPCWKALRRIEGGVATIWRVVLGSAAEEGRPAVQGVMERLAAQDKELAAIRSELAGRNEKGGECD